MRVEDSAILIVEDDEDFNLILSECLASECSHVSSAFNGEEALSLLKSRRFDLVISDVQMPQMGGFALLKAMRDLHPSAPLFLFCSGNAGISEQEALQLGANGLVHKPFVTRELVMQLQNLLEKVQAS